MKVERKEAKFQPVVITLETQYEVNALWDLLGQVSEKYKVDGIHKDIYSKLFNHAERDKAYYYYNL